MRKSNKAKKIDVDLLVELVEIELGRMSEIVGMLDTRIQEDTVNVWERFCHTTQRD